MRSALGTPYLQLACAFAFAFAFACAEPRVVVSASPPWSGSERAVVFLALDRAGESLEASPRRILNLSEPLSFDLPPPSPEQFRLMALIYDQGAPGAELVATCTVAFGKKGTPMPPPSRTLATAPFAPGAAPPPFAPDALPPGLSLELDCPPPEASLCARTTWSAIRIPAPPAMLRDAVFLDNGALLLLGSTPLGDDFLIRRESDGSLTDVVAARTSSSAAGARLLGPSQIEFRMPPGLRADGHGHVFGISAGGTYFQTDRSGRLLFSPVDTPYAGAGIEVSADGESAYLFGPDSRSFGPSPAGVFGLTGGLAVVGPLDSHFPPGVERLAVASSTRVAVLIGDHVGTLVGTSFQPETEQLTSLLRDLLADQTRFVFDSADGIRLRDDQHRWPSLPAPPDELGLSDLRSLALVPGTTRLLMGTKDGVTGLWSGDTWCALQTDGLSVGRWVVAPDGGRALDLAAETSSLGVAFRTSAALLELPR